MHATKHKRLGEMRSAAITIAKKHRVSVDAMMAALCTDQQGTDDAEAAAAEMGERFPAVKAIGWEPLAEYAASPAAATAVVRSLLSEKREADDEAKRLAEQKAAELREQERLATRGEQKLARAARKAKTWGAGAPRRR